MAHRPTDSADAEHTVDETENATRRTEPTALAARYSHRDRLGHGGMGEVLLVHDSLIGRDVALKRLHKTTVKARHRFAREARLQGRLEHPAIAPVYDLQVGGAEPYFTMKRVRGVSLRAVLADEGPKRLSQRRLLSALSQICLAVHYAHERGVVHRDIKPENVMLGDYGEVYLLDWGIAKVAGDEVEHDVDEHNDTQVSTRAGELLGSVHYMPPEQIKSDLGTLDGRADVYALGALLFEILTRQRLHEPAPLEKMVEQILAGVDTRGRMRLSPVAVPPELEAVCVAATRRDPRERLESARALHDAIERYLDGDRDAELRRDGARKHAELARHATVRALAATSSDEESARRADALREAGQALALDAANPDARKTLLQLLTTPPRHLPAAVAEAHADSLRHHIRRAAGLGAVVYFYILCNVVFMYANTIRDFGSFWATHVLWFGGMVAGVVTALRPRYVGLFAMLMFGTAASVEATRTLSPLLIVPGLLAGHAVIFALFNDVRHRLAAVGIIVVGWTLSAFGAPLGLFPRTISPMNGGLFIDTPVVELARVFTPAMTWLAFLAMIVAPAIVVGAMRSAYGKADLQLRLQSWQLGQLVPDDKRR